MMAYLLTLKRCFLCILITNELLTLTLSDKVLDEYISNKNSLDEAQRWDPTSQHSYSTVIDSEEYAANVKENVELKHMGIHSEAANSETSFNSVDDKLANLDFTKSVCDSCFVQQPRTASASSSSGNVFPVSADTVELILKKRLRPRLLIQVSRFLDVSVLTLVMQEKERDRCWFFGHVLYRKNIGAKCTTLSHLKGYHSAIVFVVDPKDDGTGIGRELRDLISKTSKKIVEFSHLVIVLLSSKTVLELPQERMRYCIVQPKVIGIEFREVLTFGASSPAVEEVVTIWDPSNFSETQTPLRDDLIFPNDFLGNIVRVAYYPMQPESFFQEGSDGKPELVGYAVDIMNLIANHLNFTIKWMYVKDEQAGIPLANGSLSGLVGFLEHKYADMGLSALSIYSERSAVVDFSPAILRGFGQLLIFRGTAQEAFQWSTYFGGFQQLVWLALVGFWLIMSTGMVLVSLPESEISISNVLFIFIGIISQQGSPIEPEYMKGRVVFFSFWFGSVVIFASYTASLTSQLAVVNLQAPFVNLDEALRMGYSVLVKNGSGYILDVKGMRHRSQAYDELYSQWASRPELSVANNSEATRLLQSTKEKYVYFNYNKAVNPLTKNNCSFTTVGKPHFPSYGHLPYAKNLSFARAISHYILRIKDSGILDKMKEKWWAKEYECKTPEYQRFGFAKTLTAFVLLAAGIGLALILFVAEVLLYRWVPQLTIKIPEHEPNYELDTLKF